MSGYCGLHYLPSTELYQMGNYNQCRCLDFFPIEQTGDSVPLRRTTQSSPASITAVEGTWTQSCGPTELLNQVGEAP